MSKWISIIALFTLLPMSAFGQDWAPDNHQKEKVEKLYKDYFFVKDKSDFNKAYSYLTPATKQLINYDRWVEITTESNKVSGNIISREIRKVTWYNNPQDSQSPGIYAAFDFIGQTEKANIYCGYLIWQQMSDGSFALLREEQGLINKVDEKSLQEDGKLEEFKAKIGCKF